MRRSRHLPCVGLGLARAIRVLAALAFVAGTMSGVVQPRPASAIDQSKGLPGICPTATGVTVVVDFQDLGGETYVRCFPSAAPATGLDALKGAGFQIEGVRRWGESFICRIENRPSAVETIPIEANDHYREQCLDTPPATGYWSYWHAGNNCTWSYSQWGVKNRTFIPGGFEGWSFSLNATADSNPVPRVAPVRPGTEGGRCTTTAETPPEGVDPDERAPTAGRTGVAGSQTPDERPALSDAGGAGTFDADRRGEAESSEGDFSDLTASMTLPRPLPRDETAAPAAAAGPSGDDEAAFSGGQDAPDVRDLLRDQDGGEWWAPWVAGAVIIGLGAGMWHVARRRALDR